MPESWLNDTQIIIGQSVCKFLTLNNNQQIPANQIIAFKTKLQEFIIQKGVVSCNQLKLTL